MGGGEKAEFRHRCVFRSLLRRCDTHSLRPLATEEGWRDGVSAWVPSVSTARRGHPPAAQRLTRIHFTTTRRRCVHNPLRSRAVGPPSRACVHNRVMGRSLEVCRNSLV